MQCNYTILVIDDDHQVLNSLRKALARSGYRVLIADDGETGYQQAIFTQPALILLDVNMPGQGGIETCRRLRGNGRTRHIPIFFNTFRIDVMVEGFMAGIDDYITKPININNLLDKIKYQLGATRSDYLETLLHGPV